MGNVNTNQQIYQSNAISGDYLHGTIATVLQEIADEVKTTYGPYGSHGLIQTTMGCDPTKDGLKLISSMTFDKSIPMTIHNSILSVAKKQVEEIGDGSTSTLLLLNEIYKSFRHIIVNKNIAPSVLKSITRDVVDTLISKLKEEAIPMDNTKMYETIYTSVDGDEKITEKLMDVFNAMSSDDPMILLEYSPTDEHRFEFIKGVEVDGTIIRPDVFFMNHSRQSYDNPYVILVNGRVDMPVQRLLELVEFTRDHCCDVIFLCSGISEIILENCVHLNQTSPGLFTRIAFFQMRNTSLNDSFLDIGASLGCNPVDSDTLSKVTDFDNLAKIISVNSGNAEKVTLSEISAKFSKPKRNEAKIAERIEDIEKKIADLKQSPDSHNVRLGELEERKAFLSNNYAKFYVGGVSPQRKAINYELVADAVPQVISAKKHGIVEGCNTAILSIISKILEERRNKEIPGGTSVSNAIVETKILEAIYGAYEKLFIYILDNKYNNIDKSKDIFSKHVWDNGYTALNIRDNHKIYNSADTDRAILENATDMAVLLATSKSFISKIPEFSILMKQNEHESTNDNRVETFTINCK